MGDRKGKWTGKEKKAAKQSSGDGVRRKGSFRYEGEFLVFDMHGITLTDAATLMNVALRRGDSEGRSVMLVHGFRSGHALRDAVRRWLSISTAYRGRVRLRQDNDGVTIVVKA